MKLLALGHAGFEVEHGGFRLSVDPWLSGEGAFLASWFPYPDNANMRERVATFTPDAIAITHEHLDHVDPWFLSQVPAEVPAIIPAYPSPVLRRKILAARDRPLVELASFETHVLSNGLSVFFVREESPMNHDAGLIVHGGGGAVVNLNDGRLSPQQMRAIRTQVAAPIDALLLQGAGASWYPMCYGYSLEREAQVAKQKRVAKLAYAAKAIKVVEPRMAFAFAGPPCFLDPELSRFNAQMDDGGIFPDPFAVTEWLKSKGKPDVSVFLPGDEWDLEQMTRRPHADSLAFDPRPGARAAYLAAYSARRAGDITRALARHPVPVGSPASLWGDFRSYFEALLGMSEYFDERIGMRVAFEVTGPGGGAWAVDFRRETRGVYDEPGEWQYRYRFESRFLGALVRGEIPWEDFFLSLRFSASRDPDLYNDHLLGLLKFADSGALAEVERYEKSMDGGERITIHAEGEAYRIPRRCPHAGNDLLETGEVLPGKRLRCLAHHYDFRLDTGACETASCPPLQVEHLVPEGRQ